ncbi:MAG: hypothetical protein LBG43_04090 [Treponema sp.]|jgi:hypothetical protein|nr:hypothetical protein [Treponema sp.]
MKREWTAADGTSLAKRVRGSMSWFKSFNGRFAYITRLNEASSRFVPVKFMEHMDAPDITKMKPGDHA